MAAVRVGQAAELELAGYQPGKEDAGGASLIVMPSQNQEYDTCAVGF